MARTFNGSTQFLTYGSAIITATPLTIAAWFYTKSTSGTIGMIAGVGSGSGANANDFSIYRDTATFKAQTQAGGSRGEAAATPATLTGNTWFHGCGVFASSTDRRAFLNGGNKGINTTNLTPTAASMTRTRIGARGQDSAIQFFTGDIAEVTYWNVALADEEVALLAKGVSSLMVRPQSIVEYIPLIRDADNGIIGGAYFSPTASPGVSAHPRIFYPGMFSFSGITAGASPEPPGPGGISTRKQQHLLKLKQPFI